ncbi:hypothetical protein [Rhizomicrobium electricum]|uniref:Uncharacterized protein n=1 Tax=Rhizomicrobium electricum TaxID=480070 RepID=A0ABN1F0S0_9PROT|nr:hypothetical protein [Rhizomicrobium electricum]NIJ50131.1 hypothetical protein [Rhizomicrobium electricum]
MRFHQFLGDHFDLPLWRRVGISIAVLALHIAVFSGLLAMRIVDVEPPATRREPAMTYITLPRMEPARPMRAKAKIHTGGPAFFNPYTFHIFTFAPPGQNAITIVPPVPRIADETKRCPSTLRPGTPEWKRRCVPIPPPVKYEDGTVEFSLVPRDSPAFKRWEAELKKRNSPVELPCTYVRTDPATNIKSNMADIGCAMRKWLGR